MTKTLNHLKKVKFIFSATCAITILVSGGIPASASSYGPNSQLEKGATIRPELFGMHVKDAEFGQWATIKIGSLRLWDNQTAWANIETAQGQFNWTNLDQSVETARKNGVTDILMVLAGTPAWATDDSSPDALPLPGAAGMPRDFSWWDNWVRNVVTRYKGKITAYQPWNEANLSTFSTGSPAEMADLTKRAYDIIKSIDSNAVVVAPSTGTRLGGPFKKFYPTFLRELGKRKWPVDVWSAHTYPHSLGTPSDRSKLHSDFELVLRSANAPKKPLWDTENNFGLKGPGPLNPDQDIEGNQAANWVGKTYLDALRLGISRVYWYRWESYNDLWGIQMFTGTPGANAYTNLQDWIVGSTFNKCKSARGAFICQFNDKSGAKFQIAYSRNESSVRVKRQKFTKMCDILGNCKEIVGKNITVNGPVRLSK